MATTRRAARSTTPSKTNGAAKATRSSRLITPDLGLSDSTRNKIIGMLNVCLSDAMVLYTKTRNYHWNVIGIEFIQFHELFETQYDQLEESIDEIAERVSQLGGLALGTLEEFKKHTTLSEQPGERPTAEQMIRNLLSDHESVIRSLRANADAAEDLGDMGTNDFFIGLMQHHEKMAWFLRVHLEG